MLDQLTYLQIYCLWPAPYIGLVAGWFSFTPRRSNQAMSSVIHIAEVAVLLTFAYALGWLVGYVARRIASRPAAVQPTIPAERIAAVTGAAAPDALVKAPIIVPVTNEAPPAAPVPDAEPVVAVAEPSTPPLSSIVIPTVAAPPPCSPCPKHCGTCGGRPLPQLPPPSPPPPPCGQQPGRARSGAGPPSRSGARSGCRAETITEPNRLML